MRNEYDDLLGGNTSYDGLIAEDERQKQQAVSTNLNTALRYNPDIFSKTKKISQQTGLPSELVERNLPEVENQIKANEYDQLISGTTVVKGRMTDQDFAKMAHDDLESLVTIEELLSRNKKQLPLPDLKQGFATAARQLRQQQDAQTEQRILNHFMRQGADSQTAQNVLTGLKLGRKHLLESGVGQGEADYWFSQQVLTPLGQIKTSPFDFDTKRRFDKSNALVRGIAKGVTLMEKQAGGAVRFGAETLGIYEENGILDQMNQALEGRMQAIGERSNPFDRNLEGAITSIVSQSPALAASIGTGSTIPALASMFVQVAGDEYETGRRAGLTYGESTTRAAIFGAAEVIGEKFGLGDLIKGLRGAAAGMPTRDVLTYITKEIAKQVPSEQLTTALQFGTDMLPKIGLNPDATAEQYVQAVMDTLVQTVLQGGIMIGSGISVNAAARAIGRKYEEAQATDQSAQTLEQVFAAAANSNLRMRDTQNFSQLVNEAAELGDGSPAQVYLNAQVLMQTMQDAGIDPSALPSVADQLPNAAESGADVVVSVGELAAAFSGTNQERTLLDQARFSEDGATVAEQREFLAKAQQAFQAEADKITAAQADQDDYEQKANSVFDKVLADLTTAGRHTNDVNTVLADLVKRFYVVKSAQMGMTPDQLYEAYPLRVQGESTTTGELLDQESPEFQSWFKDSKVVDANGKPMVVYHGTYRSFNTFDVPETGAYFTPQREAAESYGDVMPVYLSMKNPLVIDREGQSDMDEDFNIEEEAKFAREEGFDGLIVKNSNDGENDLDQYVVFDPAQIKSVNNRGTFDPNDPNVFNQDNGGIMGENDGKRVLRRELDNLLPEEQVVFDDFINNREDGQILLARLQEHKGTPWAKQAVEGVFVRQALRMLMRGETPNFQSSLDSSQVKKTRQHLADFGEQGMWNLLEAEGTMMGAAAKPVNNVNSSFINCNPSKDCAKYCYATEGNYRYANVIVKSELVTLAIEMDPVRAAKRVAAEYKASAEFLNNKALRLFDKGDGNMAWVPFIQELNRQKIRVQIFSKVPEFLRAVPEMNLRMLSVDESNLSMADENPDLPVAFIYSGSEQQTQKLAELVARKQLQVVLPIKQGRKLLDAKQVRQLKTDVKGVGPYICPIDAGLKEIGKNSQEDKWNCTKCDKNGGLGCFFGNATKNVLQSLEVKPATAQDRAARILELRKQIYAITNQNGESVADAGSVPAGSPEGLLREVDTLLGELLREYDGSAEIGVDFGIRQGIDAQGNVAREDLRNDGQSSGSVGTAANGRRVIPIKGVLNQDAAPTFYSALYQGIAAAKQENMPAAQWKAWLSGNAGQLGIKKEEIEWTGINEYFDLRGNEKITKQDVLDFLNANGVQVQEVMLGANEQELVRLAEQEGLSVNIGYGRDPELGNFTYADFYDAEGNLAVGKASEALLNARMAFLNAAPTKYGDFQMEGASNYRELLLTLPSEVSALEDQYQQARMKYNEFLTRGEDNPELEAELTRLTKELNDKYGSTYRSRHWAERNVLAHIRFNERTDAQGNKVLFIEEIQSDWGQEGRSNGFKTGAERPKAETDRAFAQLLQKKNNIGFVSSREAMQTIKDAENWKDAIPAKLSDEELKVVEDWLQGELDAQKVAAAPFVGDTKSWVALAVKRMMRYAAENGYDKVAFINGQQSVDRYSLSKQIDTLSYKKTDSGLYQLQAIDKNGKPTMSKSVPKQKLTENVGKELAAKIINGEGRPNAADSSMKVFSGLDLQVGGEGMLTFYDKILPAVVKEQLKKVGGGELGQVKLGMGEITQEDLDLLAELDQDVTDSSPATIFGTQLSFDITNEMRDQILNGLPLFQGGGNQALGTFDPQRFVITLKQGANLSTFLHEVGHFFLEVQADLAAQPNAPQQVQQDMAAILRWFGVPDVATWKSMTLDQQRPHHEKFARGFEAYLFEGNAPSADLQGAFNRFRAWLTNVYQSLQKFLGQFNVDLTNEVREVMGRMVATNDEIEKAAERRNLSALFTSAEEAGMTDEEFVAYQSELTDTQVEAVTKMLKRSFADVKWMRRARDKQMREFQKDGAAKRSEARIEARRHILQQPIYKAWQFLSGKEWGKVSAKERTSKGLDPRKDSLFLAIAKLGGLNRDQVIAEWGMDIEDIKGVVPVFGKPVFRKEGGLSPDAMGELLSQYGYLTVDENGKYDMAEFEEAVMQENMGDPYYSIAYDYEAENPEIQFNKELSLAEQLPAGRLNRAAVGALLGGQRFAEVEAKLRNFMSSDGLDPDVVAELFRDADGVEGFTSGRDLIDKLIEAVAPSEAIERLTDQIVLERYGDITSEKAAQEAADMALHNEFMLRAAANEVKTLAKLQGSVTAMARAAKEAAVRAIGKVKIKDLKPSKYAAAAMRFSRAAEDALAKKDMEGALAAKRQQFLNIAMAQYAYEVINQQRRAMQEFAKLRRSDKKLAKTYDINLVETARAVLVSFGVNADNAISSPFAAMEALDKVKAYNPDLYAVLDPIVKAAVGASRDQNGNPVNYANLTVEEFNGLRDTVRQILHQARAEKQIRVNGRAVELEQVNAELIEQLNKVTEAKPVGQREAVSDKDRRRFTLSGLRAGLRRMEAWVESQDMGGSGAFHSYLFDEVSKAVTKYRTVKNDVLRRYIELLRGKQQEGDFTDRKINAPEIGYAFNGKQELLGAMLHTGNDGNMRKLLLGRGWGQLVEIDGQKVLDSTQWDNMIKRLISEGTLTKSDYDFLQATWDLMDELKADAQQSHNYLYGYYFDEVTAKEIETPFGTYRGGYAPAKADAELVQDAAIRQGVNEIEQDFNYLMPSTGNGFTKGRVEYNRPLVMDLRLVAQHIDQVLRFTYIQPAVSDVLKLVKRGEFSNALYAADQQVTRSLILPWLQRTALQQVTTPFQGEDGKALTRFFSGLRRNTGMMVMTANFVNALQQVTGLSLTAVKVEPRYLKGALARYVGSPIATSDAIAEQSEWMKIRLQDQSFELQSELQRIMEGEGDGAKAKSWIQRHAYFMQRAMQNMVDVISWSAAYDKAIAENKTEDEAVRFADSIVRTTQGSLLPEDVSRFESGNAFTQLFTQFASYFNMQANLLGTEFAKIQRSVGMKKGAGKALYIYTMGFMIPALMADAIVRTFGWDWDDDDDDGYLDEFSAWFFGGQLRTALAMFPIVGQAGTLFLNRFNSNFYDDRLSTSPAIGAIESATGAPVSAYKAIFDDGSIKKAIKDTLGLLSLITGIPFSALGRPTGYLADYAEGKVDPVNEIDFARGVMSGKGREEERQ